MTYPQKGSWTRPYVARLPGHTIEFTEMIRGGIRAECSCGIWYDYETPKEVLKFAKRHIKAVKQVIEDRKQAKQN
jgi:hypothetical protein